MSGSRISAAWGIWRARRDRSSREKAYAFYAFSLVIAIVAGPTVHALWTTAGAPSGLAALRSSDAPTTVSIVIALLWSGALLAGRKRGPALLPPFLLHALSDSGIRRALTLRSPVLRSSTIIVIACAGAAALVGAVLFSAGDARLRDVMIFVAAAIATGVLTAMLWLVGQALPRLALLLALTMLGLAGVSLAMPQLLVLTPWGWGGLGYPLARSGALPVMGMAGLVAASIVMAPTLLDRLSGMRLREQATQWDQVIAFSYSFDFRAAVAVYEPQPQRGRRIRAIAPSRYRWITFLRRDAVGLIRTPGRSLGAVTAIILAGCVMALAFTPGTPSALPAGVAGVMIYGATGPLTKGLQHAANAAGDYPLYGISDRHLVLLHALLPFTVLLTFLTASATITAIASAARLGFALTGVGAAGILALALRLGSALKGPLPPILVTPINTPAGDLSTVVHVTWAFIDPVLAIVGALTVTMLPTTPIPLALVVIWVGALVCFRWRRRR